jgi:hypothetical protein
MFSLFDGTISLASQDKSDREGEIKPGASSRATFLSMKKSFLIGVDEAGAFNPGLCRHPLY